MNINYNDNHDRWYYKSNRLQQFKGFCMTFKYGTIREAANRMSITPSSVTKQIQSLERELNIKLFEPDGKRIKPTREGVLLYDKIQSFLEISDGIFKNFKTFSSDAGNILTIGTNHVISSKMIPDMLLELYQVYPTCNVVIKHYAKQDIIKALNSSEIDLIFYNLENQDIKEISQDYTRVDIRKYHEVLIMSKNHPLSRRIDQDITIEDLQNTNFFVLYDNITVSEFGKFVLQNNLKSIIKIENGTWETLVSLTKSGLGITMLDKFYVEHDNNIVIKDVNFFNISGTYSMYYLNSNKKKCLHEFILQNKRIV